MATILASPVGSGSQDVLAAGQKINLVVDDDDVEVISKFVSNEGDV